MQQIFKINLTNSITGTVNFNAQGDVQGGPVAIYRIKAGKSTDYTVMYPPSAGQEGVGPTTDARIPRGRARALPLVVSR